MALLGSTHPATVIDLRLQGIVPLTERYGSSARAVLDAAFSFAYRELKATTAIIEHRYIDLDFRDEFSRFYSKHFRRYPSVTDRVHFFSGPVVDDIGDGERVPDVSRQGYLGYVVIRPIPGAPVGRTHLGLPDDLAPFVTCAVTDTVDLFGTSLSVSGAPFMAQDSQYGVCAHVTAWLVSRYHNLRFGSTRHLPGDVVDLVPSELGVGRPTPSLGLNVQQLGEVLRRLGLPPLIYERDVLEPSVDRIDRIAMMYLDSHIPVIVGMHNHAYVAVGYRRLKSWRGERIEFFVHDDEVGPYRKVSTHSAEFKTWENLTVPLPSKLYMPADMAEELGRFHLESVLSDPVHTQHPAAKALLARMPRLALRTTAVPSVTFKQQLASRGLSPFERAQYSLVPMPRWIWVVELIDPVLFDKGEPCVLAEVLLDSTDHPRERKALAWRIPHQMGAWDPDSNTAGRVVLVNGPDSLSPVRGPGGGIT